MFWPFSKLKQEPVMYPLSEEQRALVIANFDDTNANLRWSTANRGYVLDRSAHANYGRGRISFRNEDGQLKASVAFHKTISERVDPKCMPLVHFDVDICSSVDIDTLKSQLRN